jgi:hypothetical protein
MSRTAKPPPDRVHLFRMRVGPDRQGMIEVQVHRGTIWIRTENNSTNGSWQLTHVPIVVTIDNLHQLKEQIDRWIQEAEEQEQLGTS